MPTTDAQRSVRSQATGFGGVQLNYPICVHLATLPMESVPFSFVGQSIIPLSLYIYRGQSAFKLDQARCHSDIKIKISLY